jgi:hypothetical protein
MTKIITVIHHKQHYYQKNFYQLLKTNCMDTSQNEEKFIPKGAMAFLILLLILCGIIWFGIYFLMLGRN